MKPLEGVRVLDFTQVLAGPLCTQYLGDLGADVIKVEPPTTGDDTRQWPPFKEGLGTIFLNVNRNKRSLAIDLKNPGSRAIVEKLIRRADVVIENFTNGVMERLGLGYSDLKIVNPKIIYCSISGYGRTGPMKDARGYDLVLQAFSGIMHMTGHASTGPARIPISPIDQATGMHAVSGILAALLKRGKTGEGSMVEVSLFETSIAFLGFNLERYWQMGRLPSRVGSAHESLCPYQVFEAADGPILIGIANNRAWERFCTLADREDLLADPRFASNPDRVAHFSDTVKVTQDVVASKSRATWLRLLQDVGVPCSAVNTLAETMQEPQTQATGIIMNYAHPTLGDVKAIAYPVRFDDEKRTVRRPPPRLGEHSAEILGELGMSHADIEVLQRNDVVRDAT